MADHAAQAPSRSLVSSWKYPLKSHCILEVCALSKLLYYVSALQIFVHVISIAVAAAAYIT